MVSGSTPATADKKGHCMRKEWYIGAKSFQSMLDREQKELDVADVRAE